MSWDEYFVIELPQMYDRIVTETNETTMNDRRDEKKDSQRKFRNKKKRKDNVRSRARDYKNNTHFGF